MSDIDWLKIVKWVFIVFGCRIYRPVRENACQSFRLQGKVEKEAHTTDARGKWIR